MNVLCRLCLSRQPSFYTLRGRKVSCCLFVGVQEDRQSQKSLPGRNPFKHGLLKAGELVVWPSMVPLTAAGVLFDEADGRGNRRNDLRGTAAIPDDRHSFSLIIDGVIPARGVKYWPVELLHSREFDVTWGGEGANRGHKDGCCSFKIDPSLQILEFDVPLLLVLVPFGSDTLN